jgi:hypothetical protein
MEINEELCATTQSSDFTVCGFCGHHFTTAESAEGCARCSLFGAGGCRFIRCPKCGYEMSPPARLPALLKRVIGQAKRK